MKVRITSGLTGKGPNKDLISAQDMQKVGEFIIKTIRERTAKGVSLTGKSFGKYADKNKKKSHIDLRDTNNMMDSLVVDRLTKTFVEVAIKGSASNYAEHVDKDFPFMGLTKKEQDAIFLFIEDIIFDNLVGGKKKNRRIR